MSHWISYNANPQNNRVGDCTVRAISAALDKEWEQVYIELCIQGFLMHDLPNADYVWGEYLYKNGFRRNILPCDNGCCVTVSVENISDGTAIDVTNANIIFDRIA